MRSLRSKFAKAKRAVSTASKVGIAVVVIVIIVVAAYEAMSLGTPPTAPTSRSLATSTATQMTDVDIVSSVAFFEGNFLPMLVGQQQGIFAKHGLNVKWVPYSGGGPMYQAAAAGSAPVGLTAVLANIQARGSNVTVKCVAVYIPNDTFQVFVGSNSTIQSVQQLNGKTVGVSALGGLEQFYFRMLAKQNNLTLDYVGTGGLTQSAALLATGRISAFVLTAGSVLPLVNAGKARSIYKMTDALPKNWQDGNCLYATDQFIQQNPQLLKRIVVAYLDVIQFIVNNPQIDEQIFMKQTNATQAVAHEALSYLHWQPSGRIDSAAFQSMEENLVSAGLIKGQAPPPNALYDTSFLP